MDFRASLSEGDSAFFYFSGHGFSMEEQAFLVPIDFTFGKKKVDTIRRGISLQQVRDAMSKASMRAIVLDACRTKAPMLKRSLAGSESSLSNLSATSTPGKGTAIAYSTTGGMPSKGDSPAGGLSFFTYYFVQAFLRRPPDFETAVNWAIQGTAQASMDSQIPELSVAKSGLFFPFLQFAPGLPPSVQPLQQSPTPFSPAPLRNPDEDLPLVCPASGSWAREWAINVSDLRPHNEISFAVSLRILNEIHINPTLWNIFGGVNSIFLQEPFRSKVEAMLDEIRPQLTPPQMRTPEGPLDTVISLTSVSNQLDNPSRTLTVRFMVFTKSHIALNQGSREISKSSLTKEARSALDSLDSLAKKEVDDGCASALKRVISP